MIYTYLVAKLAVNTVPALKRGCVVSSTRPQDPGIVERDDFSGDLNCEDLAIDKFLRSFMSIFRNSWTALAGLLIVGDDGLAISNNSMTERSAVMPFVLLWLFEKMKRVDGKDVWDSSRTARRGA